MSETEAKELPASARKLAKQREEGSVPQVAEVAGLLSASVALIVTVVVLVTVVSRLGANFSVVTRAINLPFDEAFDLTTRRVFIQLGLVVLPIALTGIVVSILTAIIYNKGVLFAMKPVLPDMKRISPAAGLKRMFGRRTQIETITAFTRIGLWLGFAIIAVYIMISDILRLHYCGVTCTIMVGQVIVLRLVIGAVIFLIVSAGIEIIVQKTVFLHEQRMTKSEAKREAKDQMGSPEVRNERRRLQRETAQSADASTVDRANMCFYWQDTCVAIRYHPKLAPVPRLTGKAKTAEKSRILRDRVAANGFNELEHRTLVELAIRTPIGNPIDERAHQALIEGLTQMFT